MSRPAERPRRGLWQADIVRAVLSGHSILGIAFAAAIYVVCVSGIVTVFMRDTQRWEQPHAPVMHAVSDAAIARAVAAAEVRLHLDTPLYVRLPTEDLPWLVLSTGAHEDDRTWIADRHGRLAAEQTTPWTRFIAELHGELHLPQVWGRFIVGLAGVALLSSLISGVLSHPRLFRDAFHLRLGGSRRLEQADLHNRLGIWPLPFHIIVSLTGALLGLSTIIVGMLAMLLFRGDTAKVYALLAPPAAAVDARPVPMPDIASLLATARRRTPEAEIRQLTISHWGRRDMRIEFGASRPRLIAQQDSVTLDAAGRVVAEEHPADQTIGAQILGAIGPLHFGWFGGLTLRIVYGLLGIALCVVTSSGIEVWLARRRDKGRATPGLERLWAAIAWGQPVVIAVTALLAVLGAADARLLVAVWVAGTVALAVGSAPLTNVPAATLARRGRGALGALMIVIGASHMVVHRPWTGDVFAVAIDLILSSAGIALLALALRRRHGRPDAMGGGRRPSVRDADPGQGRAAA